MRSVLRQPNVDEAQRRRLEEALGNVDLGIKGGGFGQVLDLVTRPGSTVALAISDAFLDKEGLFGIENPDRPEVSAGDIVANLAGARGELYEKFGESGIVGESGVASGSTILDLLGWDTSSNNFANRALRFGASFGLDVVTDPLTYMSFGGSAAGSAARTSAAIGTLRRITDDVFDDLVGGAVRSGTRVADDAAAAPMVQKLTPVVEEALDDASQKMARRFMEESDIPRNVIDANADQLDLVARQIRSNPDDWGMRKALQEEVQERVGLSHIGKETVGRVATRDYGRIDPAFVALRQVRKGGKSVLPGFTTGGWRIGSPLGGRGFTVPGSRGAGRSVVETMGSTIRTIVGDAKVTQWKGGWDGFLARVAPNNKDLAIMRAARAGVKSADPEDWGDAWIALRWDDLSGPMRTQMRRNAKVVAEANQRLTSTLSKQSMTGARREVLERIADLWEGGRISIPRGASVAEEQDAISRLSEALWHADGGALRASEDRAVHDEAVRYAAEVLVARDAQWAVLRQFRPDIGELENYLPHTQTTKGSKLLKDLAERGYDPIDPDEATFFDELLESMVQAQMAPTQAASLGGTRHALARKFSKVLVDLRVGDEGPQSFALNRQVLADAGRGDLTLRELNEGLRGALERLGARNPELGLEPRFLNDPEFSVYSTDVIATMADYIQSIEQAAEIWSLTAVLEDFGRVKGKTFSVNTQEALRAVSSNLEDVADDLIRMIEDRSALGAMKRVRIGRGEAGVEMQVPKQVANHRQFKAAMREAKLQLDNAERMAKQLASEREAEIIRLVKDHGVTRETAEALIGGEHDEVLAAARRLVETEDTLLDEFDRVLSEAAIRTGDEMPFRQARELVRTMRAEARGRLREIRGEVARRAEGVARDANPKPIRLTRHADREALSLGIEQARVAQRQARIEQLESMIDDLGRSMRRQMVPDSLGYEQRVTSMRLQRARFEAERDVLELLNRNQWEAAASRRQDYVDLVEHHHARRAAMAIRDLYDDMGSSPEMVELYENVVSMRSDFFEVVLDGRRQVGGRSWATEEAGEVYQAYESAFKSAAAQSSEWLAGSSPSHPHRALITALRSGDERRISVLLRGMDQQVLDELSDLALQPNKWLRPYRGDDGLTRLAVWDDRLDPSSFMDDITFSDLLEARTSAAVQDTAADATTRSRASQGPLSRSERIAAMLNDPDVASYLDDYAALRAAREGATERQLEVMTEAADLLEASISRSGPKTRAKLHSFLYRDGSFTAEARQLQKALPSDAFARLRNNAEYLKVLGELDANRGPIARAVRQATDNQRKWADLYSAEEARRSLDQAAREVGQMSATEADEAYQALGAIYELVADMDRSAAVQKVASGAVRSVDEQAPLFLDSPRAAGLQAQAETARELIASEALPKKARDKLAEAFAPLLSRNESIQSPRVEAGFVDPAARGLGSGPLEGKQVREAIMPLFEGMVDLTRRIQSSAQPFDTKSLNRVQSWWKTMVTVGRPVGFITRNIIGGFWNGQVARVGPTDYALSLRLAPRLRAGFKRAAEEAASGEEFVEIALKGIKTARHRAILRDALDSEVLEGFSRSEFQLLQSKMAPLTTLRGWGQALNPTPFGTQVPGAGFLTARFGAPAMQASEDFLRLATFIRHYDQGADFASSMTKAVHFDYSDLTQFEERIKRFVPFYVWARRNLELQSRILVERPDIMARYMHLMEAVRENFGGEGDGPAEGYQPSSFWSPFAAETSVIWDEQTPLWQQVWVDPDLPIRDLMEFPLFSEEGVGEATVNFLTNMVSPVHSMPIEALFSEPYSDRIAPFGLKQVGYILDHSPLGGSFHPTHDGKVLTNSLWRSAWETAFPWMREFEGIMASEDPRRNQRLGLPEDPGLGDRAAASALRLFGRPALGLQLLTPADAGSQAYEMSDVADEVRGELTRQGGYVQGLSSRSRTRLDQILGNRLNR